MANDGSPAQVPLLSKTTDATPKDEKIKTEKKVLSFQEIGVWTIMREVNASWTWPGHSMLAQAKNIVAMVPTICRFLQECFSVAPWMMTVYLLSSLWSSTEDAVGLYFSSRLLDIIQNNITKRQADSQALVTAVISRIAFTLVSCVVSVTRRQTEYILANRIRYLFDARLIQANLRLDLPTFEEPETADKINRHFGSGSRGGAWEIMDDLISKMKSYASVISQLSFLLGALRSNPGGSWFTIICLAKAMLENVSYQSIWNDTAYIWDSNPHYRRMRSLIDIVTSTQHRTEIISDVLANYIQREWMKARVLLGDTSDEWPSNLLRMQRPTLLNFIDAIADDFPLMFYAFQVYRSPGSFSLTSVALMQQASSSLAWTIYNIFNDNESIQQRLEQMKTIYEVGTIPNKLKDGELRYPEDSPKPSPGMEIKFDNVSFAYPKAESVVKDVSFTIRRGQTVVIVGVNGSGKSTLLKLFNRLYDPTSGTISIDGIPMSSFVASDLRNSSAMLFQNYTHYPLSIRENISMGLPDADYASEDGDEKKGQLLQEELVKEAARLGGSMELIDKQANGLDTVLHPRCYSYSTSSAGGQAFQDKMKEISKRAEVSLGQWQRLALSRLFFRAAGEQIKLVAADEPSASLDPEMEYEVFERLRALSTARGKTMVFVTHRFGYLTKRADLILVMQNGRLVEQGKHSELLEMGGEYTKLYNLQAEAFLPNEEKK